jgi:hypothetical protein
MSTTEIILKPGYIYEGISWYDLFHQYGDRLEGLTPATKEAFRSPISCGTESYAEAEVQAERDCWIRLFKGVPAATYKVRALSGAGFIFVNEDCWPLDCAPYDLKDVAPFTEVENLILWYQMFIDLGRIKEVDNANS